MVGDEISKYGQYFEPKELLLQLRMNPLLGGETP